MNHFLEENDFDKEEIISVFENAREFKKNRANRPTEDLFR
jgi:ornithine carbamoyltransferase